MAVTATREPQAAAINAQALTGLQVQRDDAAGAHFEVFFE